MLLTVVTLDRSKVNQWLASGQQASFSIQLGHGNVVLFSNIAEMTLLCCVVYLCPILWTQAIPRSYSTVIPRARHSSVLMTSNLHLSSEYNPPTVIPACTQYTEKWYAVTLHPATLLLIKSAATTALGFPTSDFLQCIVRHLIHS